MRVDAIILKLKTICKQCSGLISWSFENPHSAYSDRSMLLRKNEEAHQIGYNDFAIFQL